MSKLTRFATPLIAAAMMCSLPSMMMAQAAPAAAQKSTTPDWNTPPAGTPQAQKGYADGILAAKIDKAANRKVEAKSSNQYLHPPVKASVQADYRTAFASGYEAAVQHQGTAAAGE